MVNGTLFAAPNSFRTHKILIAAKYGESNLKVEYPSHGLDASKFPFGKFPTFETSEGKTLHDTHAIALLVGKPLAGSSPQQSAEILQWLDLADNEFLPQVLSWVLPSLSALAYNKQQVDEAKKELLRLLSVLNNYLLPRTFLVGERISLADVALVCNLLLAYQHVLEPDARAPYVNVNRWFQTCIHQANFASVLGDVQLCTKAAQFDAHKFKEFQDSTGVTAAAAATPSGKHKEEKAVAVDSSKAKTPAVVPANSESIDSESSSVVVSNSKKKKSKKDKKDKGDKHSGEHTHEKEKEKKEAKKDKGDKRETQQNGPSKEAAAAAAAATAADDDADATDDALAMEPKQKDPFAAMPKSSFNLEEFKRVYSNEDTLTKALPYFWTNFDPSGYSIWYCEYKYPQELTLVFMSCNLIAGMYQRLEKLRKNAFGSMCLFGSDNNSTISGVWVWRGQDLVFTLSEDWQIDYESYTWKKLDHQSDETKKLVQEYFAWEGDFGGKKFNQGKIFK